MYICNNYGLIHSYIRPTLGGALEAFPSQLQSTISVCLAVRVWTDSLNEGNPYQIKSTSVPHQRSTIVF